MSYQNNSRGQANFEEVDDFTFLRHPQQGSGYMLGNSQNDSEVNNDWEDRRRQLLAERRAIEERTLQSSEKSLGVLFETEQTGIETANELVRQGEQLNNVEEKLDSMNAMMRVSQKHLTSMKSFFGGVKNYFSRNGETTAPVARPQTTAQNSVSRPAIQSQTQSPFGSALNDDDNAYRRSELRSEESRNTSNNMSISRKVDEQLNENLSEIDLGLGRLKNLALNLGTEIEVQNQTIDRITGKAERAEDTLQYQNRQMKRILKN